MMSLLSKHGSSIDSNFYCLYFIILSSLFYFCEEHCVRSVWHMIYMITLVHCNWVSARWQRSANLYKNRKETTIYKRRNNTQNTKKKHTHTEYAEQETNIQNKTTNIKNNSSNEKMKMRSNNIFSVMWYCSQIRFLTYKQCMWKFIMCPTWHA